MTDDIVAELDRWLAVWRTHFAGTPSVDMAVIQRARDQIVAQEEMRQAHIRMLAANCDDARDAALEEAAQKAEHYEAPIWSAIIAAGIRTLKKQ